MNCNYVVNQDEGERHQTPFPALSVSSDCSTRLTS